MDQQPQQQQQQQVCPVAGITPAFATSGAVVNLEVVRIWPRDTNHHAASKPTQHNAASAATDTTSPSPLPPPLRLECVDLQCGAAGGMYGANLNPLPIELYLEAEWSTLHIDKYDELSIRHTKVRASSAEIADHAFEIVLDGSDHCREKATLSIRGWKARVMQRPATVHTLQSIRDKRKEEVEAAVVAAAAAAGENADAAASSSAGVAPKANKKARLNGKGDGSATFQAASSIIATEDAAQPTGVDAEGTASTSSRAVKKKRKRGCDIHGSYVYTPLSDVRRRGREKLNLYGVVMFARGPKRTQGSDVMLSLTLSDRSLATNDSVAFNIFRRNAESLPKEGEIRRGDVVRIHRAEVSGYTGGMVGVLQDRTSSFILIRGDKDAPIEPYFKGQTETYSSIDADIVEDLRSWSHAQLHRIRAPPQPDRWTRTLSQLESRGFFDFICALIAIDLSGESIQNAVSNVTSPTGGLTKPLTAPLGMTSVNPTPLAYIWDGTDVMPRLFPQLQRPPLPNAFNIASKVHLPGNESLLTPQYGSIMAMGFHSLNASALMLPGVPVCDGRTLTAQGIASATGVASAGPFGTASATPETRTAAPTFVHLRNIVCEVDGRGAFYIKFGQKSKIFKLDASDHRVDQMMRNYAARKAREQAQLKLTRWATVTSPPLSVTSDPLLPFTPLKVVSDPTAPNLARYRVRARVLACSPSPYAAQPNQHAEEAEGPDTSPSISLPLENICKVLCSHCNTWSDCQISSSDICSCCSRTDTLSYGYFVRLFLHDTSASIPALLCGKEADDLFSGLPASNLYSNRTTLKFVGERLKKLMQPDAHIDVIIQTYLIPSTDKGDGDGGKEGSSQMDMDTGSQLCSQDLAAFFAPQLNPAGGYDDEDEDGDGVDDDENEPGSPHAPVHHGPMKKVYRIVDCAFRCR